jgi:hypothetical protein
LSASYRDERQRTDATAAQHAALVEVATSKLQLGVHVMPGGIWPGKSRCSAHIPFDYRCNRHG